jgi:hypothetical protein
MVASAVLRVLLTLISGGVDYPTDPIIKALQVSATDVSAVRWGDVSPSLEGLKIEAIKETESGSIAYGKNQEGALVVFAWTKSEVVPKTDCDKLTDEVFEDALGNVQTPEDYQSWLASRAQVRGAVLMSKKLGASIQTLLFPSREDSQSPEDVLEGQTSASTKLIGPTPTAFIFR